MTTFKRLYFKYYFIIIIISVFILGGMLSISGFITFKRTANKIRSEYMATQKKLLHDNVMHVARYIQYKNSTVKDNAKFQVKSVVENAHAIATNIYLENKDNLDDESIQKLIIDSLRPIHPRFKNSYIFIGTLKGFSKLSPASPANEGKYVAGLRDVKGDLFIQKMIDKVKNNREGFVQYYFKKKGVDSEKQYARMSFVKHFEPFDWFIGLGIYEDDVTESVQNDILKFIETIKYGENGYVFVSDWSGVSLAKPAKGKNMLHVTDVNGIKLVQEMIKISKSGEGYIEYVMPAIGGNIPHRKISYVYGIPEWSWYIGTGSSIQEIENTIATLRDEFYLNLIAQFVQTLIALLSASILMLFLMPKLSTLINREFGLFTDFIDKAATKKELINKDNFRLQEFHRLADVANAMVEKRSETEHALIENEKRMRAFFETASTVAIVETSVHGDYPIIEFSPGAELMTGHDKDNIIGKSVKVFHTDEDVQRLPEIMKTLAVTREVIILEMSIKHQNGSLIPVMIHVHPLFDEHGTLASVLSVSTDISDMKEARLLLETQKERLAVTLSSIADGVITTDSNSQVVMMNRVAESLTDHICQSDRQMKISDIFQLIDSKGNAISPVQTILSGGYIQEQVNIAILISAENKKYDIEYSISQIHDNGSNCIGVIIVFRDISQKVLMEQELVKKQKLESIGVLAGGIAHDFNNLLTSILANTSLLQLLHSESHKDLEILSSLEKASMRAKDLTTQLLTFSKGGQPVMNCISFKNIVRETTSFALSGKSIQYKLKIDEKVKCVNADAGQISQVVNNLLINAADAMGDNGIITIECTNSLQDELDIRLVPGDYVTLKIIDTGSGIPESVLPNIFDPFYTTKETGSGLGLATCYSIIDKHKGLIMVDSCVGKGTTFTIHLPACDQVIEDQTLISFKSTDTEEINPIRILFMDDEKLILSTAEEIMKILGHEVVLVENGDAAIQRYSEAFNSDKPFDLVILDLTIPGGMGGKQAIAKLIEIDPDIKAIVTSGYSSDVILAEYKKYGFKAILAKPWKLDDFKKTIAKVVQKSVV